MKTNLLKEKLEQGGVGAGVVITEPAVEMVEILGLLGFDYVTLDCLHSPMSVESIAHLVRAAEVRGMITQVRAPQNIPEIILRYLDVGIMGIMIADMDNAQIAQKTVKAVKYPPEGERGLGLTRAADFGLREPAGEYVKSANSETMVLGVVESREGVENIEEILETEGLDAVFIGTNDLSKSLGVPGQTTHPLVKEAVDKILAAGKKTGKAIGHPVRRGESPRQYIEMGCRLVGTALTNFVVEAGQRYLENVRS